MPMTQAEQDALYNAALARREASQKAEATTEKQVKAEAGTIAVPEHKKAFGVDDIDASSQMKLREVGATGQVQQIAKSSDDVMRVVAGTMGDTAAAGVKTAVNGAPFDENMLYEVAKTRMAKQALDAQQPGLASTMGTIGDVGKIAALPGGVFATPLKAMGTSAGIGVVDTMFDRLERGEPVNANAEEYLKNAATSSVTGLAGYHIGKIIGNSLSRFVGKDPSLTKAAEDVVAGNKKIVDSGISAMTNSGVKINTMGQNRLLYKLEKQLGSKYELSLKTTPNAWRAINILRDRVAQKLPITLENFNALRQSIGKSLYSEMGLLKRDVTGKDLEIVDDIYKSLTKFADDLPITKNFVQAGGNVKLGMQGWNTMSKFQQTQARSEKIAELITNAEAKGSAARGGNFSENLQLEFQALTETEAGRKIAGRMFTPEQIKIIKKIAAGDISEKAFGALDNWIGGNAILRPLFRVVNSAHGALFQGEESRQVARKAIEKAGDTILPKRSGVKWGVASTVGAKNSQ